MQLNKIRRRKHIINDYTKSLVWLAWHVVEIISMLLGYFLTYMNNNVCVYWEVQPDGALKVQHFSCGSAEQDLWRLMASQGHNELTTDGHLIVDWCGFRSQIPWWRHQMETFSALLALCAGISPITGEFPSQRPVTRSFDVFFDLRLNKRMSKQT